MYLAKIPGISDIALLGHLQCNHLHLTNWSKNNNHKLLFKNNAKPKNLDFV